MYSKRKCLAYLKWHQQKSQASLSHLMFPKTSIVMTWCYRIWCFPRRILWWHDVESKSPPDMFVTLDVFQEETWMKWLSVNFPHIFVWKCLDEWCTGVHVTLEVSQDEMSGTGNFIHCFQTVLAILSNAISQFIYTLERSRMRTVGNNGWRAQGTIYCLQLIGNRLDGGAAEWGEKKAAVWEGSSFRKHEVNR